MTQNTIIAMHKSADFIGQLRCHLSEIYTIVEKRNIKFLSQESRVRHVSCVVLHIEKKILEEDYFERFKKGFPYIPCVAVVVPKCMELARHCGSLGIECVLPFDEIDHIGDEITRLCAERNTKASLAELSIDKEDNAYPEMIKDALSIMERDYIKILNTNEVSELMSISECTLSREFNKYGLPGPKKILMYLKVQQAIKLMRNEGLNIREISPLSGFTDEKRMAECFKRLFEIPPGEYRLKYISKGK